MMSKLDSFVSDISSGRIELAAPIVSGNVLGDGTAKIALRDLDAITAEAFNRGVFEADTDWDDARAEVEQIVSRNHS